MKSPRRDRQAPHPFPLTPLLAKPKDVRLLSSRVFDNFRSGPTGDVAPALGENGRIFDAKAAAYNTAHTPLVRRLKGRHLQMIAIGGSIGNFVQHHLISISKTSRNRIICRIRSGAGNWRAWISPPRIHHHRKCTLLYSSSSR